MNQLTTKVIVLRRINYGEADRIVTFLSPDHGKIRLMAKGVRRVKSKLAGGIELFSVSDVTFIKGRGDIGTLVSARLATHYGKIVQSLEHTMLGYELIKLLDAATEDSCEPAYFELLGQALAALDGGYDLALIKVWFSAQLLRQAGYQPNLIKTGRGAVLSADERYSFDFDAVAFAPAEQGVYGADHIKLLRLLFAGNQPDVLQRVTGSAGLAATVLPLVEAIRKQSIGV